MIFVPIVHTALSLMIYLLGRRPYRYGAMVHWHIMRTSFCPLPRVGVMSISGDAVLASLPLRETYCREGRLYHPVGKLGCSVRGNYRATIKELAKPTCLQSTGHNWGTGKTYLSAT